MHTSPAAHQCRHRRFLGVRAYGRHPRSQAPLASVRRPLPPCCIHRASLPHVKKGNRLVLRAPDSTPPPGAQARGSRRHPLLPRLQATGAPCSLRSVQRAVAREAEADDAHCSPSRIAPAGCSPAPSSTEAGMPFGPCLPLCRPFPYARCCYR